MKLKLCVTGSFSPDSLISLNWLKWVNEASKCGKQTAQTIVHEIALYTKQHNCHFKAALAADVRVCRHITSMELENLFNLEQQLGACAEMVEQVVNSCNLEVKT